MMDFEKKQEKKTGIIDTTQKQADIYSNPVMDTRSVQKNEYQHVIKPQSVNDILAEKKKGNIKNADLNKSGSSDDDSFMDGLPIGDVFEINNFVKRPVPHLSRSLFKAMNKILDWAGGKSPDYAQPILDRINDVLRADSESAFIDSMRSVVDRCVLYIENRPGTRFRLGRGNERKADVVNLLREIATYQMKGTENQVFSATSQASMFAMQNEGTRAYQEAIREESQKRFGRRLKNGVEPEQLAHEDDVQRERNLQQWGGCAERAGQILEDRQNPENQVQAIPEFTMSAEKLRMVIELLEIPDTRALDDYELLQFPGIENLRATLYSPLALNLQKVIADGGITDFNVIAKLRAKMEAFRTQLDLYDARLKVMAGQDDLQGTNAALVNNAPFYKDMERNLRNRILYSMQGPEKLQEYKAYMKVIDRNKRVDDADVARRLLIIEQNRARKNYFSRAYNAAKNDRIDCSNDEQNPVERYKKHRSTYDRILGMDFSLLFKDVKTEADILENCTRKKELVNQLGSISGFIADLDVTENKLTEEEKNNLLDEDIFLTNEQKQELKTLYEIGQLYKTYMATMDFHINNSDAYSVLAASDLKGITDEEKRSRLLSAPNQFRTPELENQFRVYEAFSKFKELEDTKEELFDKFSSLKAIKAQNDTIRRFKEEQKEIARQLQEQNNIQEEEQNNIQEEEQNQQNNLINNLIEDEKEENNKQQEENQKNIEEMKLLEENKKEIEEKEEEQKDKQKELDDQKRLLEEQQKELERQKELEKQQKLERINQLQKELELLEQKYSALEKENELLREKKRKIEEEQARHKWFVETREDLDKSKPAIRKTKDGNQILVQKGTGIYWELEDFEDRTKDRISKDPAAVLKEFDDRARNRLIKNTLNTYKALSGDDAKPGDELKAREVCLKTICDLSGHEPLEFQFIPTDILIAQLGKIDPKAEFDPEKFSDDLDDMLMLALQTGKDISDVLVPLCAGKNVNLADKFKIKEYSMAAIEKCINLQVPERAALEKLDSDLLSKVALGLLSLYDLELADDLNPDLVPEEREIKKATPTAAIILSVLTGKDKSEYEFIPGKELLDLMYDAVSMLGTEKDIQAYIAQEVIVEKRKKTIRDGLTPFKTLDRIKATKADLDSSRSSIIATLSSLSEVEESSFDLLPTDALYRLLDSAVGKERNPEEIKKDITEGLKAIDDSINVEGLTKSVTDIMADESMSKEMKDYLKAEYSINAYIKALDALKLSGDKKLSRKDFDFKKAEKLYEAAIVGFELAGNDPDAMDEEQLKGYRESAINALKLFTNVGDRDLSVIPAYDLKKMMTELILSAKDKDAFAKACTDIYTSFEKRYQGQALISELSELMGKASQFSSNMNILDKDKANAQNIYLRDFKDVAVYYLTNIANVKDITKEELYRTTGMNLFVMVQEQVEKGPEPEHEELKKFDIKANKKIIADHNEVLNQLIFKRDNLIAIRQKTLQELDEKIKELQDNPKLSGSKKLKAELDAILKAREKAADPVEIDAINSQIEISRAEIKKLNEAFILQEEAIVSQKSTALLAHEKQDLREYYESLKEEKELDKAELLKEKKWSEGAADTLNLIGDLVSIEDIYGKNGKPIPKKDRTRAVLVKNAKLLTALLNERKNVDEKGVMGEIGTMLRGAENKLFSSINDIYLSELFKKFESLSENKEKWTQDKVEEILKGKEMASYLTEQDEVLTKAITEGDDVIDRMVSESAEELFGSNVDADKYIEILKWCMSEEEFKKMFPDGVEKTTDKEKLASLRDAVFDRNSGQGKFLYLVIRNYYNQAPLEQRRFMMSYLIKDLKPTKYNEGAKERGANFFASMLKGAGPLMQKLFQGIPEHMLMKQFKPALSVVKSDLRAIPPEYVEKTLLTIKKDANDNFLQNKVKTRIKDVQKVKSLGAASIAQTFLCKVTYEGSSKADQVVVKILRPDVNLSRLKQEKKFIEKCAKETDTTGVMLSSFNSHYSKIVEELNFDIERQNAITGAGIYNSKDGTVRSVNINKTFPSGKNYLVMDKAEGVTADRYIEELKEFPKQRLSEFRNYDPKINKPYSATLEQQDKRFKTRKEIADKLIEAQKCQKNMENLVRTWITEALFKSMGSNQYFHHGDLHAGNIMINKDYVTVLDYGNCTTLDNTPKKKYLVVTVPGKVDDIIKMMAAAFKGFTDDFISFMEDFIATEGENNEYNKLDDKKKKEMKDKLKEELSEVFELGSGEDTGERIFVALLKAQEVGFKLPKEILNFSQCQQRLENSLNELNNTIFELSRTLYSFDKMAVKWEEGQKSKYDPYYSLINSMAMGNNLYSHDPAMNVTQTYMTYKSFDREAVRKTIRNIDKADDFRLGQFRKYYAAKVLMDHKDNVKVFENLHKKIKKFDELYPDYRSFNGVNRKDITDKKQLTKYDNCQKAFTEVDSAFREVMDYEDIMEAIGGISTVSSLFSTAVFSYERDSWDQFVYLMDTKLHEMYDLGDKYEKYYKAQKDKKSQDTILKLENQFLDDFEKMYDMDTLDSKQMKEIQRRISLDLDSSQYGVYMGEAALTRLRYCDDGSNYNFLAKRTVDDGKGNVHEEYIAGEVAKELSDVWERIKVIDAMKEIPEEVKKERKTLTDRVDKLINLCAINFLVDESKKTFVVEYEDYLKDNSKEGEEFRASYEELRKMQKQYLDARYKEVPDKELAAIKQKRKAADVRFFMSYRRMSEKRLRPIYDCYKDYQPQHLSSFVEIMSGVINDNLSTIIGLFKLNTAKYQGESGDKKGKKDKKSKKK